MPQLSVEVDCPVHDSFRVQQVAGMFDVPLDERAAEWKSRFESGDLSKELAAATALRRLSRSLFADGPALAQLWLFWVAPLIGGALGAAIWGIMSKDE